MVHDPPFQPARTPKMSGTPRNPLQPSPVPEIAEENPVAGDDDGQKPEGRTQTEGMRR